MPTSFHVARGLHRNHLINVSCMMRTCAPDKDWTTATPSGPQRKSEPCVHRESELDERSLSLLWRSVIEREEQEREMSRERKRETYMRGERHMREERERDTRRDRHEKRGRDATVCTFKTYTRERFERTHWSVAQCKTRNAQHNPRSHTTHHTQRERDVKRGSDERSKEREM